MNEYLIKSMNHEISFNKAVDPKMNWNNYFDGLNKQAIAEYKKYGRFKLMARIQYSDDNNSLSKILNSLKKTHSFIDWDYNNVSCNLFLKNKKTKKDEQIYLGDVCFNDVQTICDRNEKWEKRVNKL